MASLINPKVLWRTENRGRQRSTPGTEVQKANDFKTEQTRIQNLGNPNKSGK